jgi:hypothetical protein
MSTPTGVGLAALTAKLVTLELASQLSAEQVGPSPSSALHNLSSAHGGKSPMDGCSAKKRTVLLTMCEGYHGSTALESVLMSSNELGTLCRSRRWQCEGVNVLCDDKINSNDTIKCLHKWAANRRIDEDVGEPGWNYTTALHEWSKYWPLERHVLLEKTPSQWLRIKDTVAGLGAAPLPPAFVRLGVDSLLIKVLLMWRPWCLANLSSHAVRSQKLNYTSWAVRELVVLNSGFVARHQALHASGVPLLVVSYSDLLFRFKDTASRIERFLPSLGNLSDSFVPVLGRDIFAGNNWKVQGTVASYAKHVAAQRSRLESDGLQCKAEEGHGHDAVPTAKQAVARDSERYLIEHSRKGLWRGVGEPDGCWRRRSGSTT